MFNKYSDIPRQIKRRIVAANEAIYGLKHLLLPERTKFLLYKTLI